MKRPALVLAVLASVATPVLLAGPASAVDKGTLAFSPPSGSVNVTLDMLTERGCPKGSSNFQATIFGPGFPDYGQNLTAVTPVAGGASTPIQATTQYTLRDTAALVYPSVVYKGNYRISVLCFKDSDGRVTADFSGVIAFSSPVQWKVASAGAPVRPGPTTTLPPVTEKPAPSSSGSAGETPSASPSASGSSTSPTPTASTGTDDASPTASTDEGLAAAPASTGEGTPWLTLLLVALGGIAAGGAVVFFVLRRST